jgi:hypothetical protein
VLLVALVVHLSVLNQAPASAYFADTLQAWEQGRFIRFHGLAQWLGWLWPLPRWCMCCCGSRAARAGRSYNPGMSDAVPALLLRASTSSSA